MKGWSTSPLLMDSRFSLLPFNIDRYPHPEPVVFGLQGNQRLSPSTRCLGVVDIRSCSTTGIKQHGSINQTLCTLLASIIALMFDSSKRLLLPLD